MPSGMKMLATLTASFEQPAAVLAQVEDQRPRALVEHLLDLRAQLGAGAVGERGQRHVADLDPVVGDDLAARHRDDDVRRG